MPIGRERRERELKEALRKAEEEQKLHQQLEEASIQVLYVEYSPKCLTHVIRYCYTALHLSVCLSGKSWEVI